jgi:hypothetical protein
MSFEKSSSIEVLEYIYLDIVLFSVVDGLYQLRDIKIQDVGRYSHHRAILLMQLLNHQMIISSPDMEHSPQISPSLRDKFVRYNDFNIYFWGRYLGTSNIPARNGPGNWRRGEIRYDPNNHRGRIAAKIYAAPVVWLIVLGSSIIAHVISRKLFFKVAELIKVELPVWKLLIYGNNVSNSRISVDAISSW